ncbi:MULTISPECIES: response regulator transcription factor [Nocardiopsis]|jgi:two-component system response regulator TrcR|uniref:DNA-binding response OmpR family regulator n=1 Tax=Nocardiopsis sinuspersici TaxID=501010 RepID=A0A1V3C5F5_9ACTN|nr:MULTISPECIES: response regulator transcription factor [Nocardiopsis]NYH52486.1 DNA-binding response OmpR family regulator [Nocardiopsis sinuspersici]OOC55965.1 DNA-binding response regulator [Nocardiopsis sinuspersici]
MTALTSSATVPFPAAPAEDGVMERAGRPEGPIRVLLVEPESEQSHQLVLSLSGHDVDITVCVDGAEALLRVGMMRPDTLVTSADPPEVDLETLVRVTRRATEIPILIGVGPGDSQRAMRALAVGATACVSRPYRIPELAALLRGSLPGPDGGGSDRSVSPTALRSGALELDALGHRLFVDGEPVNLALREFGIMDFLLRNNGRVVSREELWTEVWHKPLPPVNNTIAVHIRRLRHKLGDSEARPRFIHTVRGIGYRLDADAAS